MKIKKLWVSKYKNIVDQTFQFNSNLITLLVGQNGLGKSNLLEVLALIFCDLDLIQTEEEFQDWAYDHTNHFEYDINYECKGSDIRIQCLEGFFRVSTKNITDEGDLQEIDFLGFKRRRNESYLPDYVIGYYSGENKRIRAIIKKHEDQVIKDLKANTGLEKGFRKLFFAEDFHWPLILLTLLLYSNDNNNDPFNNAVSSLLENFVSISELEEFGLQLKNPRWYKRNSTQQKNWGINLLEENISKGDFAFWNAKGKANKMLKFFYERNDVLPVYYYEEKFFTEPFEIIELNEININTVKKDAREVFVEPMDFFDAFETLELIDILSSIHLSIKSGKEDNTFDYRELSEGEQQLVTVLGLLLITGKDDCLFLLDEPDTHLNPKWQRDFVRLLKGFNLNEDRSHILVATHSPLIVQAAEESDILLYKLSEEGEIEIVNNERLKIHNWRIDQVLASDFFGFESTRPPQLDNYMLLREKILAQGILTEESEVKLKEIENEFGVLPTGETLDEIKSIMLIKSFANKINDKN